MTWKDLKWPEMTWGPERETQSHLKIYLNKALSQQRESESCWISQDFKVHSFSSSGGCAADLHQQGNVHTLLINCFICFHVTVGSSGAAAGNPLWWITVRPAAPAPPSSLLLLLLPPPTPPTPPPPPSCSSCSCSSSLLPPPSSLLLPPPSSLLPPPSSLFLLLPPPSSLLLPPASEVWIVSWTLNSAGSS